jgi:flagellar L-ring protein precursor FlgH
MNLRSSTLKNDFEGQSLRAFVLSTASLISLLALLFLLLIGATLLAQSTTPAPAQTAVEPAAKRSLAQKITLAHPSIASTSLAAYLSRVRTESSNAQPTAGAIWIDNGRLTRMNTDVRAMRPNDLISVVVEENLAASTDGSVKNSRASNASSQITSLFGLLHAGNALQNLVGQTSTSGLNAQGQSATNSSLTTVFGGQVVDVLANGMLVIEAARQVEFSQQTQTIVLRGLVRPEDISQQNQVLSTAISSLELEVRGKGIVNDATYRQNPLVRLLERILIF